MRHNIFCKSVLARAGQVRTEGQVKRGQGENVMTSKLRTERPNKLPASKEKYKSNLSHSKYSLVENNN